MDLGDSQWRQLVERIPVVAYVAALTENAPFLWVSPQVERLLGHPPEAFMADDELWYRCIHPEDVDRVRTEERDAWSVGRTIDLEFRMFHADGRMLHVWERDMLITDDDGTVVTQGVVVDITELREAEAMTREERDRAERYLDVAGTMIVALDEHGRIERINPAGCELLGYGRDELEGRDYFDVVLADDERETVRSLFVQTLAGEIDLPERYENAVVTRDGRRRVVAWHNRLLRDAEGQPAGVLSSGLDITERREAEEQISFLAYHDALTGLPNRALLQEHLDLALARARRAGSAVALLYLDLDDFKVVNDSLGHAAGDRLLSKVATRLAARRRESDLLARQGGDEFLLLIADLEQADAEHVARVAAGALVESLQTPFLVAGAEFHVSASVGISLFPRDAHDAETILRHADAAMYRAKAAGRDQVRVFDGDHGESLRRLSLTSRLRGAISEEELVLHFQPIVDPSDGTLHSLEALVRWEDPLRGLVLPGEFIPFAEETGLIGRLGEHVVELVCRQRRRWRAQGLAPRVAMNVSARQLDARFPELLRDVHAAHGLEVEGLTVELTESALMAADLAGQVLEELTALGVELGIDDFGAGFSSLGRLRGLPFSMLKVDRSFVAGVPSDRAAGAILTAVVELGRALGTVVVAEGIEREDQRRFVALLGCPLAQGFGLHRPVPAAELDPLLLGGQPMQARQ